MSTTLTQLKYTQMIRDIRAIVQQGREAAQKALQRQILDTNWEVGKYSTENLLLEKTPSANNAKVIQRLARAFSQPDAYFYMSMKLYRYYPKLPSSGLPLTWSHYLALLTVTDDAKRAKYEKISITKGLVSRDLYALIANDRAKEASDKQMIKAADRPPQLLLTRGKLYHYIVTAPKTGEANTGEATIDVGFEMFRDIPISKTSKMRAGYMVRTIPVVVGGGTAHVLPKNLTRGERYVLTSSKESSGKAGAKNPDFSQFTAKMSSADRGNLYTYKAEVERVVDGDTLVCMIDLGLKAKTRRKLRLRGIDCPELTTKRGIYVKDHVKKFLNKQEFVIVKTYKDDKYGRMLADVFYLANEKNPEIMAQEGILLNQKLLDEKMAEIWA